MVEKARLLEHGSFNTEFNVLTITLTSYAFTLTEK